MKKKSNRRIAREKVLQIIYAYDMNEGGLEFLSMSILADLESKEDKQFANNILNSIVSNRKEIMELISAKIDNWEMDRVAIIDKILLQLGIAEILFFPDIPPKVSINEMIEIAKEFSTASSGKFINGILDAIHIDLKNSGRLNKTGRGLIDEPITQKNNDEK
ncbi:MAG: transcription antitermination factor NusB [Ignavibacteriales bacterium CG_4_9_14_3_um_filter_34_10]|nr:MAG: transcription antitermination factor NusB [Ignavibacteriales bacterium CG_4_9_14_3_um_filter_34_10]